MGKKYIIELEDNPFHKDGDFLYRVKGFNSLVFDMTGISKLTLYPEPDLAQVRKYAYKIGYEKGYRDGVNRIGDAEDKIRKEAYQKGLSDAWEAARKISLAAIDGGFSWESMNDIFGTESPNKIYKTFTASEAIEKIRQYEQEEDRQAKIEFNCEEIKDVLNTTMKECNVSLDEIAAVLEKMRGEQDG